MKMEQFEKVIEILPNFTTLMHITHEPGDGLITAIKGKLNNVVVFDAAIEDFLGFKKAIEEVDKSKPITFVVDDFNRCIPRLDEMVIKETFFNFLDHFNKDSKIILVENARYGSKFFELDYAIVDKFSTFNIEKEIF